MTPNESDPIARRAREVFAAASAQVDATTAGRLRLARRTALSAPPSRAWGMPLAAAIAVALGAWLAWPRAQAPDVAPAPVATDPVAPAPPSVVASPVEVEIPRAGPDVPLVEAPVDDAPADDLLPEDDADWDALEDEDAEVYAWLADAPVAPDSGADAL
jgi:hypothetical protein